MSEIIDAKTLRGFRLKGGDHYRWFDGKRYHAWAHCFDEKTALDTAKEYRERNKVLTKIVKVSGVAYDEYAVFAHKTRQTRFTSFI